MALPAITRCCRGESRRGISPQDVTTTSSAKREQEFDYLIGRGRLCVAKKLTVSAAPGRVAPPQCRAQHDGAEREVSANTNYPMARSSRAATYTAREASDIVQFTDTSVNRFFRERAHTIGRCSSPRGRFTTSRRRCKGGAPRAIFPKRPCGPAFRSAISDQAVDALV